MEKVIEFIEQEKDRFLQELIEILKIPSISSLPQNKPYSLECAHWVANQLKNIGCSNIKLLETSNNPVVFGENLEAGPEKPTILIYGHYDVQPVDPIENWDSDPFQPVIKNNKIFARGSADDKAQFFCHIKAIEAYRKTNTKLPVNIKFIIEGDEESGNEQIDDIIKNYATLLKCETVLVSDTEWFAKDIPSICYALRGIAYFEMTVTGPNRDLHSGTYGGALDNPINALCWIISNLKDRYGRITIPNFYDDVLPLSTEEKLEFLKLPFNEKEYCADLQIKHTYGEIGFSTLERTWARPSLDVNGIWGGYTGEGAKTVIPSKASAKFSIRLVPNQKANEVAQKVIKYIQQIAPPTVNVDIKYLHGGNPVLVPLNSKGAKAGEKAIERIFGKKPVFTREGGSIPIVELFSSVLRAPTVLMGFSLPTDNIHSPNENFDLNNFFGGIKCSAVFFDEYSKL